MPKIKTWASDGSGLEPYRWRTTQRESRSHYDRRKTPAKWGAIINAIIAYQNENDGVSPTNYKLAKLARLSTPQLKYHMTKMEDVGLIKTDGAYPQHITVNAVTKPTKTTEERIMNMHGLNPERVKATRKPFMARAKDVAVAITEHTLQYGEPPEIKWLTSRVYGKNEGGPSSGGYTSTVVAKMVKLGWVSHKKGSHSDLVVTDKGRTALFDEPPKQQRVLTLTPAMEMPKQTVVELRRAGPEPSAPKEYPIKGQSDVDLIIELTRRGFKVSR